MDDKTTDGEEYASAPAIVPWNTNVLIKKQIIKIKMKLISRGIFFYFLLLGFYFSFETFFLKNKSFIGSIQTSNSQLIPMADEIQAAGANTKSRRIITEAKYTLSAA